MKILNFGKRKAGKNKLPKKNVADMNNSRWKVKVKGYWKDYMRLKGIVAW